MAESNRGRLTGDIYYRRDEELVTWVSFGKKHGYTMLVLVPHSASGLVIPANREMTRRIMHGPRAIDGACDPGILYEAYPFLAQFPEKGLAKLGMDRPFSPAFDLPATTLDYGCGGHIWCSSYLLLINL